MPCSIGTICPACDDPLDGENIIQFSCGHAYHLVCLQLIDRRLAPDGMEASFFLQDSLTRGCPMCTKSCANFWKNGRCRFGDACSMAHHKTINGKKPRRPTQTERKIEQRVAFREAAGSVRTAGITRSLSLSSVPTS